MDADKVAPTQVPAKDSQPVLSAKPEQALLEQIQHLLQQWLKVKGTRANWLRSKRLHQINRDLNKQVSELQEEVRISHRKGTGKT